MSFSVGILYSVQEFLRFAHTTSLSAELFAKQTQFVLVSPREILQVSQDCNWIRLTIEGDMVVTERGQKIIEATTSDQKLRLQIEDLISWFRPSWAARIRFGREETIPFMPSDVKQCFMESGLMDVWDDVLIRWWKGESQAARIRHGDKLADTGHRAELLTNEYEEKRTGQPPDWVALDTTFAGFDVLSRHSREEKTDLRIEVKGSERPPKSADFVLTRKESDTASDDKPYVVHLWYVSADPQLFVVPYREIAKHIPDDRLTGRWQQARIPFRPFSAFRVSLL